MIIKKMGKWFGKAFDLTDLIGFGGLGMVFYGLYQWRPFLAYVIVGGIVFLLSVVASLEAKKPQEK